MPHGSTLEVLATNSSLRNKHRANESKRRYDGQRKKRSRAPGGRADGFQQKGTLIRLIIGEGPTDLNNTLLELSAEAEMNLNRRGVK